MSQVYEYWTMFCVMRLRICLLTEIKRYKSAIRIRILNAGTLLFLPDRPILYAGKCFLINDQQWSEIIDLGSIIGQKNGRIIDPESWGRVPTLVSTFKTWVISWLNTTSLVPLKRYLTLMSQVFTWAHCSKVSQRQSHTQSTFHHQGPPALQNFTTLKIGNWAKCSTRSCGHSVHLLFSHKKIIVRRNEKFFCPCCLNTQGEQKLKKEIQSILCI